MSDVLGQGFYFSKFGMEPLKNDMQVFSLGEVLVEDILAKGYTTELKASYSFSDDIRVILHRIENRNQDNLNLKSW